MTGAEALDLHVEAQELLRRQAIALRNDEMDAAEAHGAEVGRLLDRVTRELGEIDEDMRERLLAAARTTAGELAKGVAAFEQARQRHVDANARAERDGAAIKRYLPATASEPARFLDERR